METQRLITVELTVPDPAWQVQIERVFRNQDRLHVVSRVQRAADVMAAQVISRVSDQVRISAPDLPVEHYILGKTWNWAEEDHHFIDDERQLEERLQGKKLIFDRASGSR